MSKAGEWPGGWQMPGPGAVQWGTDKAGKCPAVPRWGVGAVGAGGID